MRLGKIHISRHYRITENEWKCIKIQKSRKINYIFCVILQITTCSEQAVIWFWKNVFLDNQMNVMHKKLIKLPFWIDCKTFFCEGRRAFLKHDSFDDSKLMYQKFQIMFNSTLKMAIEYCQHCMLRFTGKKIQHIKYKNTCITVGYRKG